MTRVLRRSALVGAALVALGIAAAASGRSLPAAGQVLQLTSGNATAALTDVLRRRFGSTFTSARQKWVRCPKQELFPPTDDHSAIALCRFEFGNRGGRFVGGYADMGLVDGDVALYDELSTRSYRKDLRACRIPSTRGGWVNGITLSDRRLTATSSLGGGSGC